MFILRWENDDPDRRKVYNAYAYLPGDRRPIAWVTWVGGYVERPDDGWVARVAVQDRSEILKLGGYSFLEDAKREVAERLIREYGKVQLNVPAALDEVDDG